MAFILEAIRNMHHTGSVWPSSRALGMAMSRSLRGKEGPRRILEVGPGNGPFTRVILESLRDGDEYHLSEINEVFCQQLEVNLLADYRQRHPERTVVLNRGPVQDLQLEHPVDFIVCGLPFNNFPPTLSRSIFRKLIALIADRGELAYFEYAAVRGIRAPFVGPKGRERIRRIGAHGKSLSRRYSCERELVLANFPPAVAIRLRNG